MSEPTASDYKTLVITQVGDTAGGILATNIDLLWAISGTDDVTPLPVRFLATKLAAIDTVMGEVRKKVTMKDLALTVELSDLMDHLQTMRENTAADYAAILATLPGPGTVGRAAGAVGNLTRTTPTDPPSPFGPNANSRRLRGDAYAWPDEVIP